MFVCGCVLMTRGIKRKSNDTIYQCGINQYIDIHICACEWVNVNYISMFCGCVFICSSMIHASFDLIALGYNVECNNNKRK